jgi:hypothetical protein
MKVTTFNALIQVLSFTAAATDGSSGLDVARVVEFPVGVV